MTNIDKIETGATAPVIIIDENNEWLTTENPEIAQEIANKVLGGLLKIARAFVPTRENLEGKKEQCDVSLYGGTVFINTEHASYLALIELSLDEMCKKRGPLRPAIAQIMKSVSADINYGVLSPWLKLHGKNVKSAYIGIEGFKFVVAKNVIELNIPATARSDSYAITTSETLDTMVPESSLIIEPIEVPAIPDGYEAVVLSLTPEGLVLGDRLKINTGCPQLKIRKSMIPAGNSFISAYTDTVEGYVIRLYTEGATFRADQYYRVLPL